MLFSSLVFLFLFLPLVLVGYYLLPRRARNGFLLVANFVFYGFGEPAFVLLMLFSILFNYAGGLCIARIPMNRGKKAVLIGTLGGNLLLLGIFKYAGFLTDTLRLLPPLQGLPFLSKPLSIPLPIGISFYTFQAMSYLVDVYRGECKAQRNAITFGAYISLFPQLIAGPIVRYQDVEAELMNPDRESVASFNQGVEQFLVGLAKKVLLANPLGALWTQLSSAASTLGAFPAWCGAIAFSLQLYFDFSGYSDMACGLGRLFGFSFCPNFNYPYLARSVTDFWRRWHMSLTTWFRDYVYIPLGGNRRAFPRVLLNIAIVWTLTGLWHGASWNFVCWGAYYAVILILEKLFLRKQLERLPGFLQRGYTLFLVVLGWVLFALEDVTQLRIYIAALFGQGHGLGLGASADPTILPLLVAYLPLLLVAIFASTSVGKQGFQSLPPRVQRGITGVASVLCLTLCTAALVSDSYNPFLYFRF